MQWHIQGISNRVMELYLVDNDSYLCGGGYVIINLS